MLRTGGKKILYEFDPGEAQIDDQTAPVKTTSHRKVERRFEQEQIEQQPSERDAAASFRDPLSEISIYSKSFLGCAGGQLISLLVLIRV